MGSSLFAASQLAAVLRAPPSARCGAPSAQLRFALAKTGGCIGMPLQPGPREGARSACTPGLADGQGCEARPAPRKPNPKRRSS